jgi:hypothetical protein
MYPFPGPDETINRTLEGVEQETIEDEVLESRARSKGDRPKTDEAGAETKPASEETLDEDDGD